MAAAWTMEKLPITSVVTIILYYSYTVQLYGISTLSSSLFLVMKRQEYQLGCVPVYQIYGDQRVDISVDGIARRHEASAAGRR